jgi:hypothetical protein
MNEYILLILEIWLCLNSIEDKWYIISIKIL